MKEITITFYDVINAPLYNAWEIMKEKYKITDIINLNDPITITYDDAIYWGII